MPFRLQLALSIVTREKWGFSRPEAVENICVLKSVPWMLIWRKSLSRFIFDTFFLEAFLCPAAVVFMAQLPRVTLWFKSRPCEKQSLYNLSFRFDGDLVLMNLAY